MKHSKLLANKTILIFTTDDFLMETFLGLYCTDKMRTLRIIKSTSMSTYKVYSHISISVNNWPYFIINVSFKYIHKTKTFVQDYKISIRHSSSIFLFLFVEHFQCMKILEMCSQPRLIQNGGSHKRPTTMHGTHLV